MIQGIIAGGMRLAPNIAPLPVFTNAVFVDNFTGDSSLYGRFADTTNHFSPDMSWWEQASGGFTQNGYLRHTGDPWGGAGIAELHFSSYTTVAEYTDANAALQTLDIQTAAHKLYIGVTRIDEGNHACSILRIEASSGSVVESYPVLLNSTVGVIAETVISVPTMSLTDRYAIQIDIGTGVDYFAITAA